ncbi:MAG: GNAT family N-acetyltransferase [Armatimonadota bacterium]
MIRLYREQDRQALKDITAEVFRPVAIDANIEDAFGPIGGLDWSQRKLRHIDADCDANPAGIFVAEQDGEVVGYITSRVDHETKVGWIPNLAVSGRCGGQGIAHRLMERVLECLREQGMELVRIETLEQNAVGQHLFPKFGFQETARQIHYAMRL